MISQLNKGAASADTLVQMPPLTLREVSTIAALLLQSDPGDANATTPAGDLPALSAEERAELGAVLRDVVAETAFPSCSGTAH